MAIVDGSSAYASDAPQSDPAGDRFRRWPFAQRVAATLASRTDPTSIVVAVYGAWGEGKTTVLNFVARELRDRGVLPVWFNPWRYQDEDTLLLNFFDTLGSALDLKLRPAGHNIGSTLKKYAFVGGALGLNRLGLDKLASGLGSLLADESPERIKLHVNEVLTEEQCRIVVLIDDVDRLDRDEIYALFRLIRLTADFAYVSYILAFDPEIVAASLGTRFGSGDTQSGSNFIDKIVQVPLYLPKADEYALKELCFDGVNLALEASNIELTEEEGYDFTSTFDDGVALRLMTPRMARRYGNALMFALPLLRGEVYPVDLMLLEAVRIFYPLLYEAIRRRPELFVGNWRQEFRDPQGFQRLREEVVESASSKLTTAERHASKSLLLRLFPQTRSVTRNEMALRWAEEQKRVASESYFQRYFSYAVPEGDISDVELTSFIEDLEDMEVTNVTATLQDLMGERGYARLIDKLRVIAPSLTRYAAIRLARGVVHLSAHIPGSPGLLWLSPLHQAARLIAQLLNRVAGSKERLELATEIMSDSESWSLAYTTLRLACPPRENSNRERLFSDEDENKLGIILANRVADAADDSTFFVKYKRQVPAMLYVWSQYGGRQRMATQTNRLLNGKVGNVVDLIKCFLAVHNDMPNVHEASHLDTDRYNSIKSLVDVREMYTIFRRRYKSTLDRDIPSERDAIPFEEAIARRFAFLFLQDHGVEKD